MSKALEKLIREYLGGKLGGAPTGGYDGLFAGPGWVELTTESPLAAEWSFKFDEHPRILVVFSPSSLSEEEWGEFISLLDAVAKELSEEKGEAVYQVVFKEVLFGLCSRFRGGSRVESVYAAPDMPPMIVDFLLLKPPPVLPQGGKVSFSQDDRGNLWMEYRYLGEAGEVAARKYYGFEPYTTNWVRVHFL